MATAIEKIEQTVEQAAAELSPSEISQLITWLDSFRANLFDKTLKEGVKTGKTKQKLQDMTAFGMWSDRKDMEDPLRYVNNLRKSRYKNAY